MKKFLLPLLLITGTAFGQNETIKKLSTKVSQAELKKNLYFLASEKMEGRLMASRGDTLASLFIANHFKKKGLKAPYKNGKSYFQEVVVHKKNIDKAVLTVGKQSFSKGEGWNFPLAATETLSFTNVPIVFGGYGIDTSTYNDFASINVQNKAVLLLPGQPRDASGKYLLTGTTRPAPVATLQNLLKKKGAAMIIVYNPNYTRDSIAALRRSHFPTLMRENAPANTNLAMITVSERVANAMLAPVGTTIQALQDKINSTGTPQSFSFDDRLSLEIDILKTRVTAPNVIGVIKGRDPKAGNIIISAHHDHDGKNGDLLWPGAVDNASGTVAIMEIARLMNEAVKKGQRPKRTVIFASYTGEERGLLGSNYFAEHPLYPLATTWGVMNIDMMGRVDTFYSGRRADSSYAYILVKDTVQHGLREALYKAHEATGQALKLDTYYEQPQFMQRRLTGSDQYPFFLKGVPFVRIDCGFSKDYHQTTDTPDKINYPLLQKQVQLAFLTGWNMAND